MKRRRVILALAALGALAVNLKVARQLGIALPPAVLVRADRLIE